MFQLFGSLKTFIKPQSTHVDNLIFRLHYRVTVTFLIGFSLMMTAHQYFGDPIDCVTKRDLPSQLLDTYCWIHSTYSVEGSWEKEVGVDIPYPGVDNSIQPNNSTTRIYHGYYQWVCFVLFFQGIFFYLPHHLWKMSEGGLLKNLILNLHKPILKPEDRQLSISLLADFLLRSRSLHQKLFLTYVICEVLNLLNVFTQMLLMDTFLGGHFFSYGWEVLQFKHWDWPLTYSPMTRLFPRVTKCEFFQYGPSAGIERFDTMCLLPVNILSEKVYMFLWFWFYFLALSSSLVLFYRLLIVVYPFCQTLLIYSHCRTLKMKKITKILKSGNLGDWFLLHLLAKNIHTLHFHELILQLEEGMKRQAVVEMEMKLHHAD